MQVEPPPQPPEPWAASAEIGFELPSTPLAVRDGLDRVVGDPALSDLNDEARGTLWTVLAEVLNNVVEHAYAERVGVIGLRLWRYDNSIAVEVLDHGAPMPGLELPAGCLTELRSFETLPEGGFGWFLIRSMTDWLIYDRIGDDNRLRFCMECV
jgi:serine/threonine-protein kinase RsbW